MKKPITSLLLLFLFISVSSNSQNQSLSLNSGYSNQSFYSLSNGEVQNTLNNNWDLAFSTDIFSSSIRINDGKGTQLYNYHLGDTNSWNSINSSTPNILTSPIYNSDTSWDVGAFNVFETGGFDYSWGVYNLQSHHVIGDSLYVIQTINGNWKKLWIKSKESGEYFIQYADLDGSNLVSTSIAASNYSDKRFVYYSLDQSLVIDREPSLDSWDISFTKYITDVQGIPYPVTGVLSNVGIDIAKATNISNPYSYIDYDIHPFDNKINSMGYDWKSFSGSGYVLDNQRCYFIRDYQDNIWRLIFEVFEGTSSGNIEFNIEAISTNVSINHEKVKTFQFFPNPARDRINVIYEINIDASLTIYDLNGRLVFEKNLEKSQFLVSDISINHLESGIYIISMYSEGNEIYNDKLIIN